MADQRRMSIIYLRIQIGHDNASARGVRIRTVGANQQQSGLTPVKVHRGCASNPQDAELPAGRCRKPSVRLEKNDVQHRLEQWRQQRQIWEVQQVNVRAGNLIQKRSTEYIQNVSNAPKLTELNDH